MNEHDEVVLALTYAFLKENYNYVYLKAMLEKGKETCSKGATLITGSSHGLYGIKETLWDNAINCSMHSQDIYYDFMCARSVLDKNSDKFDKCFIVMGYYMPYHDLSRSTVTRKNMISKIYYPIFGDAHNWESPYSVNLYKGFEQMGATIRFGEKIAIEYMTEQKSYFSIIKERKSYFDLQGRLWEELSNEERDNLGKTRAENHGRQMQYLHSLAENKEIMKDYVHYLHLQNVLPVVVVTPFTQEYNKHLDMSMKDTFIELLNSVEEELHFVDFNECDMFDNADFMDTDHLSESGARKVSITLTQIFGK